jgi:hypothetical protein
LYCVLEENNDEMHSPPAVATSWTDDHIENIGETLIDLDQVSGDEAVGTFRLRTEDESMRSEVSPEPEAVPDQEEMMPSEVVVSQDEERISDGRENVEPRVVANEAVTVPVVDCVAEVQQQKIGECRV